MVEAVEIYTIDKGYLGNLRSFELPIGKRIHRMAVYSRLQRAGLSRPEWQWDQSPAVEFEEVEQFLFVKGIPKDAIRMKLGDFDYHFVSDKTPVEGSGEVFLMLYRGLDLATLFVSIRIEKIDVDVTIALRKALHSGEFLTVAEQTLFTGAGPTGYTEMIASVEQAVIRSFVTPAYLAREAVKRLAYGRRPVLSIETYQAHLTRGTCDLIEIRRFEGIDGVPDDAFHQAWRCPLYGLITMDEGWRFVPEGIAAESLKERWGSRTFLSITPFAYGLLILNLKDSEAHRDYQDWQNRHLWHNEMKRSYFNRCYTVAGMDHGTFYALENANIMRLLVNRNLKADPFMAGYSASRIIRDRKRMIETISLLSEKNIDELDRLGSMIHEQFRIDKHVESVRERLELAENDTLIKYEVRTNRFMIVLTVIGLFLAITSQWEWLLGWLK